MTVYIDSTISFSYLYSENIDKLHRDKSSYLSILPRDLIQYYITPYTGSTPTLMPLLSVEEYKKSIKNKYTSWLRSLNLASIEDSTLLIKYHVSEIQKNFLLIANHYERVQSPYYKIQKAVHAVFMEEVEGSLRELTHEMNEEDYQYMSKVVNSLNRIFKEFEKKYFDVPLLFKSDSIPKSFSEDYYSYLDYASITTDFERSSLIIDKLRQVIIKYIDLKSYVSSIVEYN